MTALALLQQLRALGVALTPSPDGTLHYKAPKGILTDDLRQAIRQHKTALLHVLAQPIPLNKSPLSEAYALGQSAVPHPSSPRVESLETSPVAWRCYCCMGTRRWRSIYGVVVCGTCHPP